MFFWELKKVEMEILIESLAPKINLPVDQEQNQQDQATNLEVEVTKEEVKLEEIPELVETSKIETSPEEPKIVSPDTPVETPNETAVETPVETPAKTLEELKSDLENYLLTKPVDPELIKLDKYIYNPVSYLQVEEKTLEVTFDSNINQFPTVNAKIEVPSIDLEIVLAPLKSLEVCQIFQKILYIQQTCPKSSFSPNEPILLYGFSLYGPFPNPSSCNSFRYTLRVTNNRTEETQLLRTFVYDQKEKFYKFFLNSPMYLDSKDFLSIVSIKNSEELENYELGFSKKLVDSSEWKLEAFKDFRETSEEVELKSEAASGQGGVFVLSSDNMYFYGSDGVRFCVSNHFYNSVGSVYYEKI